MYYLILRRYELRYGVHLNTNMRVGRGLRIAHGNGVYVNCSEIGENFTIYQNATLGCHKEISEVPSVGDGVTVYAGAVVVGRIQLHSGCIIGANAFVNRSVEAGAVVGGNPAKRVK